MAEPIPERYGLPARIGKLPATTWISIAPVSTPANTGKFMKNRPFTLRPHPKTIDTLLGFFSYRYRPNPHSLRIIQNSHVYPLATLLPAAETIRPRIATERGHWMRGRNDDVRPLYGKCIRLRMIIIRLCLLYIQACPRQCGISFGHVRYVCQKREPRVLHPSTFPFGLAPAALRSRLVVRRQRGRQGESVMGPPAESDSVLPVTRRLLPSSTPSYF